MIFFGQSVALPKYLLILGLVRYMMMTQGQSKDQINWDTQAGSLKPMAHGWMKAIMMEINARTIPVVQAQGLAFRNP